MNAVELQVAVARFFHGFAPRSKVDFRWSGEGLMVRGNRGAEGLVRPARAEALESAALTRSDAVAVLALGVFAAATLRNASRATTIEADAAALFLAGPPVREGEWLGYRRIGSGWVTTAAVGEGQLAAEEFALHESRRLDRRPTATACRMQSLGVASLPIPTFRALRPSRGDLMTPAWSPAPDPPAGALATNQKSASALAGRRVLCLGRLVAAPWASSLLEGLGAEVCRVRPPGQMSGRGGIELDLLTPHGRRDLAELVGRSDMVIENYRPRGWDQVVPQETRAQVRRHVAIRGFPSKSLCRNWKVLGFMVEAMFGLTSPILAEPELSQAAPGVPFWDRIVGTLAAAEAVQLLGGPTGSNAEVSLVGTARTILPAGAGLVGG